MKIAKEVRGQGMMMLLNEEAAIRLWQMRQGLEDHPLHRMAIHTPIPDEKESSSESEEEDESED